MNIKAVPSRCIGHRMGTISGLTQWQIAAKLGIEPATGAETSDSGKVKFEWWFTVTDERGEHYCNIWDYRGSSQPRIFSWYGDVEAMRSIFGDALRVECAA